MPIQPSVKLSLPIWVLNLERSDQRRYFMKEQLRKFNLKFEIIKAVDGRSIPERALKHYSRQEAVKCAGRELSPGEVACALSHAKMWERLIAENLNEVLVLEDDVIVVETFIRILDLRHKFPADWEFMNFLTSTKQIPFGSPVYDIYRACRFEGHANGACAYLLSRAGAEKLLSHVYPIRWAADGLTGRTHISGLVSYGIDPRVVTLGNFKSDIWKGHEGF